jgi:hypothetical protein
MMNLLGYVGGSDVGPKGEISDPWYLWSKEENWGLSYSRKGKGTIVQHTSYMHSESTYNKVIIENYSQHAHSKFYLLFDGTLSSPFL